MNCKTITLPKHACKWNKAKFDHVLKSFLQKVTSHDSDSIGFNLIAPKNPSGAKI